MSTSSSSSSVNQYGVNLVVNGGFTGNASGWILSGGAYYASDAVVIPITGGVSKSVSQSVATVAGRQYLVSFDIVVDAGKTLAPSVQFGGSTYIFNSLTAGAHTCRVILDCNVVGQLRIILTTGFNNSGSLDNVEVREYLDNSSSSQSSRSSQSSSSRSSLSSSSSTQQVYSSSSKSSQSFSSESSSSSVSSESSQSSSSISSLSSSSQSTRTTSSSQSSLSSIIQRRTSSSSSKSSASSSSSSFSSGSSSSSSPSSVSSWSTGSSQSTVARTTSSSQSSQSSLSSESSQSSSSSSVVLYSTSSVSSSSTFARSSSSSVSSQSSSSSESSGHVGWMTLPFDIQGTMDKSILCFVQHNNVIYAGTANNKIIQSDDGVAWDPFPHNVSIEDDRIRSLYYWENALFVGTESRGRIYVKNFSTGNFYLFVQTPDHAVSSFAEYNGVLYAGTSPSGIIYSFNGIYWKQEFQAYGGVSAMVVAGTSLLVFLQNAETAVAYNGSTWSSLPVASLVPPSDLIKTGSSALQSGGQNSTIASFRDLATEPVSGGLFVQRSQLGSVPLAISNGDLVPSDTVLLTPSRPETSITAAVSIGSMVILGGKNGVVFSYIGGALKRLLSAPSPISSMSVLGDGTVIVGATSRLFLLPPETYGVKSTNIVS